jgi:hypothetical protein
VSGDPISGFDLPYPTAAGPGQNPILEINLIPVINKPEGWQGKNR